MILQFMCVDGGMHPVVGKVWYQIPTCVVEGGKRYDRYLCSALSMTMHSPDDCVRVLALLDSVQNGQSAEETFGLNDTEICLTAYGAQVDILIEDEITVDGLFGLTEFRAAVAAWHDFLSEPCTHEHVLNVDIG